MVSMTLIIYFVSYRIMSRLHFTVSKLHAYNRKYLVYTALSPVVVYTLGIKNGDVKPVWVSRNIQKFFGYTVREALAKDWWLENIHEDDRQVALENFNNIFTDKKIVHEYRFRKKMMNIRG